MTLKTTPSHSMLKTSDLRVVSHILCSIQLERTLVCLQGSVVRLDWCETGAFQFWSGSCSSWLFKK